MLLLLPLLFLVYYYLSYYQQEDQILAIDNGRIPQSSSIGLRIRLPMFFQGCAFLFLFYFYYSSIQLFFYSIEHQGITFLVGEGYSGVNQTTIQCLSIFLYILSLRLPSFLSLRPTKIHSFLLFLLTAFLLIDYDRPTDRPTDRQTDLTAQRLPI